MPEVKEKQGKPILSFRVPQELWTQVNDIVGDGGDRTAVCVHLLKLGLEQAGANPLELESFTPIKEFKAALSRQEAMESKLQELAREIESLKKLDLAA